MKKAAITVLILLSFALTACGTASKVPPAEITSDDLAGMESQSVSAFLAGTGYDAFAERIEKNDLPESVWYFVANGTDAVISDPEFSRECWNELSSVRICIPEEPSGLMIDDGDILFCFKWEDGSSYSLLFVTSEYFSKDNVLYPLADRAPLRRAINDAEEYAETLTDDGTAGG